MRILLIALVCLCLVPVAGTADAGDEFLVLARTPGADRPPPGATASSGDMIRLPEGAVATLIGRHGRIVRLVGPCDCVLPILPGMSRLSLGGSPANADRDSEGDWQSAAVDLSALLGPKTRALSKPGAARDISGGAGSGPPDLWLIGIDTDGDNCVKPGEAYLWRHRAAEAMRLDLSGTAARLSGVLWSAGEHRLALPSDLVADGELVIVNIGEAAHQFLLHVLPGTIDEGDWGEILIWMAASRCRRQAQFLVDGLHNGTLFPEALRRPGLSEL